MPQTKQIPSKDLTQCFLKNNDTNILERETELADEFSFDFFKGTDNMIPVDLINRSYNEMADSIQINSFNNLSKSGNKDSELKAEMLQSLLKNPFLEKLGQNFSISANRKKTRLLVKRGVAHIALLYHHIALIYIKEKVVYAIDNDSKKYSVDKTLTELEEELDPSIFFRANRQYIINLNFIRSFKAYQKVKLLVDMDVPELKEPVVISQQVAPAFKKWMNDA